jgi:hypothetical protein
MKPSTVKKIVRPILVLATGLSAYSVTNAAIRSNLDEPETRLQKASLALGVAAISGFVAENAASWIAKEYDGLMRTIEPIDKKTDSND